MRATKIAIAALLPVLLSAPHARGTASKSTSATYEVDPVHSTVLFRVKHLGVSYFYGRFNKMSGSFTFDPASPGTSSFEVTVKARSIDTNDNKRDKHLRNPDFFNAKEFPEITFKSTAVKSVEPDIYTLEGDLTLHGVTKPISVTLNHIGSGAGRRGGHLRGFEGKFTIKRSDFGMDYMLGGLGDEVNVTVSLEGKRGTENSGRRSE